MCGARRKEITLNEQLQKIIIEWNQEDVGIGKATRL
jgi:hypothetical protein